MHARTAYLFLALLPAAPRALAWDSLEVDEDALVRMPGSQPDGTVSLDGASQCLKCHAGYDEDVEPGFGWKGSMMAQAARDPLYWASVVVAAQDSIWALGNPNAADICLRCHFPEGWVEGRSDPTNASLMTGSDYDGVHCDVCHRMVDPFFAASAAGTREGTDFDEPEAGVSWPEGVATTYAVDAELVAEISLYDGETFYDGDAPVEVGWHEAGGGQIFLSPTRAPRGPFADASARHEVLYSRFTKSRYFCGTCHDVSNPVLHNLDLAGTLPGDGTTVLPTEIDPAHRYFHVERTFSEFMLSAYGADGGAAGSGAFHPDIWSTSHPDNVIQTCQDCHMASAVGAGADRSDVPIRPTESTEHPKSGVPTHGLSGGNLWVPYLLASTDPSSDLYDSTNAALLGAGSSTLTLDLSLGTGIDADALEAEIARARTMLTSAATIENVTYDAMDGSLSFDVMNHGGHKLPSGYPEGRRAWVNIQAEREGAMIWEVNPYDDAVGTLVGLDPDYSPASPSASSEEEHVDTLVYEAKLGSNLTGETSTFHFALADHRHKDNRIPPRGFDIDAAPDRLVQPVWDSASDPDTFSRSEYEGGTDHVELTLPTGADRVVVRLYYQTTSREYITFLADEINGTASTLDSPTPSAEPEAYVVQTDPFFDGLAAWGDTIWELWEHNMDIAGAHPVEMTALAISGCTDVEVCDGLDNDCDGLLDDEDDLDASSGTLYYRDADGDGWGSDLDPTRACDPVSGHVAEGNDCDDGNAEIHPGAVDIPDNDIDEDCDGEDATDPHTGDGGTADGGHQDGGHQDGGVADGGVADGASSDGGSGADTSRPCGCASAQAEGLAAAAASTWAVLLLVAPRRRQAHGRTAGKARRGAAASAYPAWTGFLPTK